MLTVPSLLAQRRPVSADDIDVSIVPATWRPAVFGGSSRSDGEIDKNSYVFCVLVKFQRHLKRRGIYAPRSTRWTDPRVSLLDGDQWESTKNVVLTALALPDEPSGLLVEHRTALDDAYRRVAAHLAETGSDLSVDDAGRVHLAALDTIPEPDSLVELRSTVGGMLPRVDLSQIVLEVMGWEPGFVEAFRSWSGGDARLDGLDISIAACLVAQATNVGYAQTVNRSNPALHRDRLSHVAQTYITAENMGAANRPLIDRQAGIDFAELLGGGLVAAVNGMRFVVPTQTTVHSSSRRCLGMCRRWSSFPASRERL
ncbi:MAG: Tn3 family transposase [Ilumatobacter sp.]